jgi:polyketide synthase 12
LRVRLSVVGEDALSLVMVDESGALVASVDSLVSRAVAEEQLGGARGVAQRSLFGVDWVAVEFAAPLARSSWVLVGDGDAPLAGALRAMGGGDGTVAIGGVGAAGAGGAADDVGVVEDGGAVNGAGAADAEGGLGGAGAGGGVGGVGVYGDLVALGEAVDGGVVVPEVVLVDCTAAGLDGGVVEAARGVTHRVLGFLQGWLADERFSASRMVLLTRGAVAVGAGGDLSVAEGAGAALGGAGAGAVDGLAQAPVWGLVRSAQSENPGRFVLIDVDSEEGSWEAVLRAALASDEPQLAVRGGSALAPRLTHASSDGGLVSPAGVSRWRLDAGGRGTLEDLALVECREVDGPLGVGQVRVAVHAAGLNFRDVLIALGVYPGEARIGSEGAGVVLEVGPQVEGLARGDRVMGLLDGAFGPVAVTDRRLLAKVPDGWSFAEAAAVPIVFLTAYYALVDLAGVRPGERLLVHAAAGGVGMAAVQLARYLGAEVFVTASSGKWDVLEGQGLEGARIASSRTLEFKERFLDVTGGRGMDVVLDCLAGEFVDASLGLLPGGGRFIEMGKVDIRDPGEVAASYPGVAYRAFDLVEAGPERIQEMLAELLGLFERGVLEPLPVRVWDVRRAPEAFRFMSQARHVGKIVLTVQSTVDRDGTVLITGGTGGLGALVARHLVGVRGVRSVVLASRRGREAPGALELQGELEELGARVGVVACDVSDRGQLESLIASVPAEHPLRAVVHAAGVLDDGVLGSLTGGRLDGVMAPKVRGAWYLHELTEHMELRGFVLFSSAAGVFGGAGQGNYAAGNAFLDALAGYRRARGLPGTSIAWGLWDQSTGMTERLGEIDQSRLTRMGVTALARDEGLELFDAARVSDRALLVGMRLDPGMLRPLARAGVLPPLLRGLVRGPVRAVSAGAEGWLARRLAEAPESERERVALELVRSQAAGVLGHASPEAVPIEKPFLELGFDSLTAVELRNRLGVASGLQLPATLVFDYPNPTLLAGYLLSALAHSDGQEQHSNGSTWDADAQGVSSDREPTGTLGALMSEASVRGRVNEFMGLLISVSGFRPAFDSQPDSAETPKPVRLAEGEEPPGLICLPSILATAGPHQYAKFASAFRGERNTTVLPLPGFIDGERVPATMDVVAEAHAEAIRRLVEGAPFVLAGHSTGGILAYALASHLERIGVPAAGVVLIDSYPPGSQALAEAVSPVMGGMLEREGAYVPMSDTRLTAMGAYSRLLVDWRPTEITAPTLFVGATEPLPGISTDSEWRASWSLAHLRVEVPGNHFTMLEDHAAATAQAVRNWLLTTFARTSPTGRRRGRRTA